MKKVGVMGRVFRGLVRGVAVTAMLAGTAGAQAGATVSGQVSIQERPGEITEDLSNIVVFLEPLAPDPRSKVDAKTEATIALDRRQFSPRVTVVMAGSRVEFPNRDPFSHNVFSKLHGGFDTGVYGRGTSRAQTFDEAGVYPLYCNVHPRMTAFVVTLNTPYYTQAGASGRFVLESVSPGRYNMTVWHDRATKETREVMVPATGLANLKFALDARGYKYVQHKDKVGKDYVGRTGDRY